MFNSLTSIFVFLYLFIISSCEDKPFWPGEWLAIAAPYSQCCFPAQFATVHIFENNDELIAVTTHSNDPVCQSMGFDSEIYEMRYPWSKDELNFTANYIKEMNERVNSRFVSIAPLHILPEGAKHCMGIETNQAIFGGKGRCPYILCQPKEGEEIFVNRSAMILEGSFNEGMYYGDDIFNEYFKEDAKKTYRTFWEIFETRKFSLSKCQEEPLIPAKIHTIWMGFSEMPAPSMFRFAEWKRLHPKWEMKIWGDAEVNEIVKPYQTFFDKLRSDAMKVDFVRLLILKQEGGLFVELDVLPKKSYDDLICRYEYFTGVSFSVGYYTKHMIEINVLGASKNNSLINANIQYVMNYLDAKLKKFDTTFYSIFLRDNNIKNLRWIPPWRGPYHLLAMTVMMFSYTYSYWDHYLEANKSILLPRYYHNPYSDTYDVPYSHSEHFVWKDKPLRPPLEWDQNIKIYMFRSPFEENKYIAFREKYIFADLTNFPFQRTPKIPQVLHLFTNESTPNLPDWEHSYSHWKISIYVVNDNSQAYCQKLQLVANEGGFAVSGNLLKPMFLMDEIAYKLDFVVSLDPEEEDVIISDKFFGAKKEHNIIKNVYQKDCSNQGLVSGKSLTNTTYHQIYLGKENMILPSNYFFCNTKCNEFVRNVSYTEFR